jgi:hypothetical protein
MPGSRLLLFGQVYCAGMEVGVEDDHQNLVENVVARMMMCY